MRGKGEGSVYKRTDGLWAASVELPPRNGKRRRKVLTGKDKATVQRKLRDAQLALREQGDLPTAGQTVEQWLNHWLENIAVKEVRPKTYEGHRGVLKNHVIPTIGTVRLDKLTPAHVRRVHDAMTGAGLSSTYALLAHRVLSQALKAAEAEGRIYRNPAALTAAPRKAVTPQEALTVDEAVRVLEHIAHDPEMGACWATSLLTGARRGEVIGLTWDRVTDQLDFSWQLQRLKRTEDGRLEAPADYEYRQIRGGLYWTRPKSSAGWRIVPLVDPLRSILERYRDATAPNPWDLVFTRSRLPIDPDDHTAEWNRVLDAAGVEKHVVLHGLRHTAVDLLYAAEPPIPEPLIMEIVGHSSRATTRGYRSRGNSRQLTAAMERMYAQLAVTQDAPSLGVTGP